MCLPENENGTSIVGFLEKRGIGCSVKKWGYRSMIFPESVVLLTRKLVSTQLFYLLLFCPNSIIDESVRLKNCDGTQKFEIKGPNDPSIFLLISTSEFIVYLCLLQVHGYTADIDFFENQQFEFYIFRSRCSK